LAGPQETPLRTHSRRMARISESEHPKITQRAVIESIQVAFLCKLNMKTIATFSEQPSVG
jgi:hypothetical protein